MRLLKTYFAMRACMYSDNLVVDEDLRQNYIQTTEPISGALTRT